MLRPSSHMIVVTLCVVAATGNALATDLGVADVQTTPTRFLVGERVALLRHESYVLPLSEPADIAAARDLITFGPDGRPAMVIAKITAGANGINRNYHAAGSPQWSWHSTDFLGFVDLAAEIYDGWPRKVEQNVEGWILNTAAVIGFSRWTVVAELP